MLKERTLSELRKTLKGKIYIYLNNEIIGNKFLHNAEGEGFLFGKDMPSKREWANIVALGDNKQLCFTGFFGHMAFQSNGGSNGEGNFHRIDYQKFINGDTDYFFRNKDYIYTVQFKSNFFGNVTIIGDKCKNAIDYIDKYISLCKTRDQENALYNKVTNLLDVVFTDYKSF